ncbi:MAG: DoxX family protein [Phycisphaerales bacterium]|nr:DoxX family protein [Phycisphaerales bacterium]
MNNALTKTSNSKHIAILRIIAGAPLFAFGVMHITGMLPMKPLVEAAGLPLPDIMSIVGPLAQIIAGVLLLFGMHARVGAVIAIGTMLGAVVTHIKIPSDAWPIPVETAPNPNPYVPMMVMAVVIILFSVYVLIKGAGAWSLDSKSNGSQISTGSTEL